MCSFIILAKVSWSQYKSCFPSHEKKLSWNLNRILLYKIGTCELLDILYFSWIYHIYEILRDILQLLCSLSLNLTDYINLFKAPLRKNRFKKSPPFFGIEKKSINDKCNNVTCISITQTDWTISYSCPFLVQAFTSMGALLLVNKTNVFQSTCSVQIEALRRCHWKCSQK